MSDQPSPPKPKPGSLRDRIAAFENKGASGAPPGPPRPKPGNLQWKPKPPSPPTTPGNVQSTEYKPPSIGGMSASDAMESIGRAGSLKERMAALQGKGAFGGAPPPIAPKPNVDRPKWKPPPAVPTHVASDDESKQEISAVDAGGREASRSPPPRAAVTPTLESQGNSNRDEDVVAQEGDTGDQAQDPEEQERQRRAAIAARMARLGGARFGMAPPIFAPKPVIRKSESAQPASEAKEEAPVDQSTVLKESSEGEALITSPPQDLQVTSPAPEAVAETERNDETDPSPPVPTRALTSMPVPAGPRRAAPPRKKASRSAPTAALPEPPVEDVQSMGVTEAERAAHDVHLTTSGSQKDISEGPQIIEVTSDGHPTAPVNDEQLLTQPPIPTKAFREAAEEPEQREAEAELVEGAASRVEGDSMRMAADDQDVPSPSEQPLKAVYTEEEDEEERRHRVAVKLAQMGAFNPLAGPPPAPRRPSLDEPTEASFEEPLDAEDEVNVDTEEYGETIPPPPTVPSRLSVGQSVEHDAAEPRLEGQDEAELDVDTQVPADRDGEHVVASYAEEQGDRHDGHTSPSPESSEEQPIESDLFSLSATGTASTQQAGAIETSLPPQAGDRDIQECRLQGDGESALAHSRIFENDTSKNEVEEDEMPPPRVTRPIPPPPVNLRSKPTPPSSPPLSPPPRSSIHALRAEEEERPPASPDMPPRPIPPPGRIGSFTEDVPSPPARRSMPPPPRRTSVRLTETMADPPPSPPPVPTSPRPVSRRPPTPPPIITTLVESEQATSEEHEKGEPAAEEVSEDVTPQPGEEEDEASARRRAIADRMARLGGIRFGAPPPMNPLVRPPLPAAPPPTSIPPDEMEAEVTEEEGPREEEEEDEVARKQRIAARLVGMGGMRLGMLPPAAGLPPVTARRFVSKQEDSENEDAMPPVPVPAPLQRSAPTRKPPPPIGVTVEQEPKQTDGGSRRTSEDSVRVEAEESEVEEVHYSNAEVPVASEEVPALPPPRRSSQTPRSAEVLPTPPPRVTSRSPPPGRPPIPMIPTLLGRRPSATTARSVSVASSRNASIDDSSPNETPTATGRISDGSIRPPSEYVMVEAEEPDSDTSPTSPPRRRPTREAPPIPLPPVPPPSAIDPPESLTSSAQWELPSIPQGNEFGETDMASSGWSEGSTAVHIPVPVVSTSPPGSRPESRRTSGKVLASSGSAFGSGSIGSGSGSVGSGRRSIDQPSLTTDELMAVWGKVGVQVVDAATALFDKSKRALVGDGSFAGFVRAVLAQVPGVTPPSGGDEWGYMVYAQTGGAVQRRVSDILPGDVVAFWDAKFKGHKGLHAYTQTAGTGAEIGGGSGGGPEPLVGIVSEFDGKKSKVRVWQANQHVGQQTVEIVSYRLDDLKSGQVKVYRVLDA